jgi:uncharacterized membrane protein
MSEMVIASLKVIAQSLEIVGGGMLLLGFIIATGRFFVKSFQKDIAAQVQQYRKSLARVIIIGLELLVAATIIKTMTLEPSVEGMGILVSMVAIRTALGWTTVLEMTGRWPWQT